VDLKTTEKGLISAIRVSMHVPWLEPEPELDAQAKANASSIAYAPYRKELVGYLQAIEANLGFTCGGILERIRCDDPLEVKIPESAEEEGLLPRAYLRGTFGKPTLTRPIPIEAAREIVRLSLLPSDELPIMAFWREGKNEYQEKRYLQAFYNYYFVIEGLFANGQFTKRGVLKAFSESTEMSIVTDLALRSAKSRHPRLWPDVLALFGRYKCVETREGAQELLFLLRGELHHFAMNRGRLQPNPLLQEQFEAPAWLAQQFAFVAIARRNRALPHPPEWKPLFPDA
jgi:hypothetical protein